MVAVDIEVPTLDTSSGIVHLIVLAVGVWAPYCLGIERGQDSDNQRGPNPLRT